jgi:hypothetical protein
MRLTRLMDNLKMKKKKFIIQLLSDLVKSALITIKFYLICLFLLYVLIISEKLIDPSGQIRTNLCESNQINNGHNNDMQILASFLNSNLNNTDHKYFICYRTLFDYLKLKSIYNDAFNLDVCLFNQYLNPIYVETLLKKLVTQDFDTNLKLFQNKNKNFSYYYNTMFGYYHLKLNKSNLFIYLFAYSPETKYEFETIRRIGFLYTQFSYLAKLSIDSNYFHWPIKIPFYMIQDIRTKFKIKLAENYFLLPNDAYSLLMHSYPNDWFKTNKNCTF